MKINKIIILDLLSIAASGCWQATKRQTATTENVDSLAKIAENNGFSMQCSEIKIDSRI